MSAHRNPKASVACLLLICTIAMVSGRCLAVDASGTWSGNYAAGDTTPQPRLVVTLKKAGGVYTGTVSMPDEEIAMETEDVTYDDGYLSVSGLFDAQDGKGGYVRLRAVFEGYVEDGRIWNGNWMALSLDGDFLIGNTFTARLVAGGGATPRPSAAPASESMAGFWGGSYRDNNGNTGEISVTLTHDGDSYSGSIRPMDESGNSFPVTVTSGGFEGRRFVLAGTLMALSEDDERVPAEATLSGEVRGDEWRGTLTVRTEDGDVGLSGRFRLRRQGGAVPAPTGSASRTNKGSEGSKLVRPDMEGDWKGNAELGGQKADLGMTFAYRGDTLSGTADLGGDIIPLSLTDTNGDRVTMTGSGEVPDGDRVTVALRGPLADGGWKGELIITDADGDVLLTGTFAATRTDKGPRPTLKPRTGGGKPTTGGKSGVGGERSGGLGGKGKVLPEKDGGAPFAETEDELWRGTYIDLKSGEEYPVLVAADVAVEFPDAGLRADISSSQTSDNNVSFTAAWTEAGKSRRAAFTGVINDGVWEGMIVITEDGKVVRQGAFTLEK